MKIVKGYITYNDGYMKNSKKDLYVKKYQK